ncbi:NAD(P)H-dependent oxidoreductase [Epilithonimonas ginsengisoli]|uniref:NAD(P)H-dependent oxidoreductase n=1 Tax=Epilithonimonas ginsengisoli TaxID=1245592 RepID=A0ABU4JKU4_9FLAO|nr:MULTISPECIES: NAD(P)H-dependent oxidoreductase [Chryseobacterium group]MBV6881336.1 NAD(P)H-dependent oxidoreductase [Epilithonimonas sp. FP105]MDW8550317.1 NAD(P)H-dependent oxidoreductase [Epilithonimonas ginsengisoli]OAH64995.1 NAD(P)H-dependent oxidoreductase [Chryseobacterium sp. FP211-J200]
MNYLEALNWRYSVKRFNGQKISSEKLNNILEAGRLSVSSQGLQPYHLLVVENDETIQKLIPAFYNPSQISTCSHLIALVSKTNINKEYVDNYFNHIINERGVTLEQLVAFRNNINSQLENQTSQEMESWSEKQSYIVLGSLIMASAQENIDSCPMEGFKSDILEDLLKIDRDTEKITVVLTLGYRAEDDNFQNFKKVRKPADKFIKFL